MDNKNSTMFYNIICNDDPFKDQIKHSIRCQKTVDHEGDHFRETKDSIYEWEDKGGVSRTLKSTYKLHRKG